MMLIKNVVYVILCNAGRRLLQPTVATGLAVTSHGADCNTFCHLKDITISLFYLKKTRPLWYGHMTIKSFLKFKRDALITSDGANIISGLAKDDCGIRSITFVILH